MELNFLDQNSLFILNNIRDTTIKNRLIREFNTLLEDILDISINMDYEKSLPVITIKDNKYSSFNIYSFIIDKSYPFRPPFVYINSIPYIEFCRINTLGFCKNLKKVSNIYCFCCNTIIHTTKWSPITKIYDIVMEIRNFKKNRRDVINKIFADVITKKYLNSDINLYSWLF